MVLHGYIVLRSVSLLPIPVWSKLSVFGDKVWPGSKGLRIESAPWIRILTEVTNRSWTETNVDPKHCLKLLRQRVTGPVCWHWTVCHFVTWPDCGYKKGSGYGFTTLFVRCSSRILMFNCNFWSKKDQTNFLLYFLSSVFGHHQNPGSGFIWNAGSGSAFVSGSALEFTTLDVRGVLLH